MSVRGLRGILRHRTQMTRMTRIHTEKVIRENLCYLRHLRSINKLYLPDEHRSFGILG